ncbi:GNAT family N-acetyltransferase [Clostridium thermarum]|uniref:GNAT family N-acetyltransferase n=1 Tax=Clostridium thermarum TaxID=1716543 RepID=UPI0013D07C6A|nr:GNAT family protein [Clostridium thermarum]
MVQKLVTVENVTGREGEYIIKDHNGITAGRFFLIDYQAKNRSCIFRVNYYEAGNYDVLREALQILLRKIFSSTNAFKVNILISEETNIRPFTDLGFMLEGVLEESIISNGYYKNELLFGINAKEFENNQRTNVLRLKGNNMELKILTPEDAEDMTDYYIRNKTYLQDFEPAREETFYTTEVQKRILMESYKQYLNGIALSFGIYKDNKLIGKIQLSNIVMGIFRNGIVGYSIDKDFQGKGYMKEALKLVLEYAFNEMDLHRIEASTLVDNIKSQRVLLSCGFKEVGINKEYLFINGAWRDHKTFYIINN